MNIKQLKCFVAAAEAENFTRASEQLHIAQSAFSRHITNLETELGMQLFTRMGRGVELTPEGVSTYDRARKLLADFEAFQRDLSPQKGDNSFRKISMAAHGGIGPMFLPYVARMMKHSGDQIRFRISEALSEEIERNVCSGECDIGIVMRRNGFQVERSDLETVKLADDDMFVVRPSDDGGLIGKPWSAKMVMNQKIILAPGGSIERASFENWAHEQQMAFKIIGEAVSVSMRLELARKIDGICVLPGIALTELLRQGHWQIHQIEKDDYLNGIEWFVIFRRTEGDRLIRVIVDVMQQQAKTLSERSKETFKYML
jgi:DNA-binding transcriptional LysR family regulator